MTKKLAILVLMLTLTAALFSCGKDEEQVSVTEEIETMPVVVTVATEPTQIELTPQYEYSEPEETYENGSAYEPFGTPLHFLRTVNDREVSFTVNVPDDVELVFQNERESETHLVYLDGREFLIGYVDEDTAASAEDVFTVMAGSFEASIYNGLTCENELEIESCNDKNINGKNMVKAQMRLTIHDFNGTESETWKVLAYSTELDDGGYAYLLVVSPIGGKRFIALKQAAENMALTFREGGLE